MAWVEGFWRRLDRCPSNYRVYAATVFRSRTSGRRTPTVAEQSRGLVHPYASRAQFGQRRQCGLLNRFRDWSSQLEAGPDSI
jgi:hypothetical protein